MIQPGDALIGILQQRLTDRHASAVLVE